MQPRWLELAQHPGHQNEQTPEDKRIMELLDPYFERLAIVRPDSLARYDEAVASGIKIPNSRRLLGMVACISDQDFNHIPRDDDYVQRRKELTGTFAFMAEALCVRPECSAASGIDWANLSYLLLDDITLEDQSTAFMKLRSAFGCSLFADDRQVRQHFLESIYSLGLEDAMAEVLERSHLSFVDTNSADSQVYDFNDFAGAFQASSDDVVTYAKLVAQPINYLGRPKTLLGQLCRAYERGDVDDALLETAQAATRSGEAEATRLDPYKIERFALQDRFIQDQANLLFSGTTVRNSPLAVALAQKADGMPRQSWFQLRADVDATIEELSAPIVALYTLPAENISRDSLTERQALALRYCEIVDKGNRLARIDHYIDYSIKARTSESAKKIWSIALSGADAPQIAHAQLYNLTNAAGLHYRETGDKPAAEELYRLALFRRKHLIRIAMMNREDFGIMFAAGDLSWRERTGLREAGWIVARDTSGQLEASIPLELPDALAASQIHSGPTLGCPAGKISSKTIEHASRMGSATNNFIDYIVEVMIHEAHRRNLFDLPA